MFRDTTSISEFEAELANRESRIALLRAEQVVLVQRAERAQATQSDGSRSMEEWVQARLDVRPDVARDLVLASRRIARHRRISGRLAHGTISFDRAIATLRYAEAGATADQIDESLQRDLATVSRLRASQRHVATGDERSLFADRYFVVQPSLDETTYRMWGQLPGVMGRTVEKAISQRADEFRAVGESTGVSSTRGRRQADSLAAIAQDSLDHTSEPTSGSPDTAGASGQVTVFVDATHSDAAETGAEIMYGPRVGPNTLEAMLCGGGLINVVGLDGGVPIVTSRATRAIPPAIRQTVAHRDGGCTIDGVHLKVPAAAAPRHPFRKRRNTRCRQPHDVVLVPPSCRDPRVRVSDRSGIAATPQAPHPTSQLQARATPEEPRPRQLIKRPPGRTGDHP